MSDVKKPSVGRVVHFFPSPEQVKENQVQAGHVRPNLNSAKSLPAIVLQEWGGLKINLSVFFPDNITPVGVQWSINHKSEAQEGAPYWDWPEIK